jgi:hypothetical protein
MRRQRAVVAGLLLSACLLSAHAQDKQWDSKGCGVTENTVVDKAGDSVVMYSTTRGNAESAAFGRSVYECRAVANASKENFEFSNRCTFVDAEGNRFFVASTGSPKGWQVKFVGGAGKWEGLTGTGQGSVDPAYGRISPTLASSCYKANGTYSIKKAH